MGKKIFKYAFLLLSMLMLFKLTALAKVNSPDEAQQKITEIQSIYNGKCWNAGLTQQQLIDAVDSGATSNSALGLTTTLCGSSCSSNTFQGNTQCKGFARYLQYLLWGKLMPMYSDMSAGNLNGYSLYEGSSLNSLTLQPGDFVWTPGHAVVIWKIENGYVYVAEAWGTSGCKISWSKGYNYSSSYDTQSEIINKVKSDGGYIARYTDYITDTEAPTISNLRASNISSDSFTVKCDLADNVGVTRVWMVVYGPGGEKQFGVSASNGSFSYKINTADYGGAGEYSIHLYAYDAAENSIKNRVSVQYSYTITYDANGGSGAPTPQTKKHGETVTLSTVWPSRPGYAFWGWATTPDATTATWASGGEFAYDGDITLYAFWKEADSIITYDANGGSGAPESQIKPHGKTIKLSTVWPSRPGYVFWGWATSPDSTVATWPSGGDFANEGNITLYAFWKPNLNLVVDKSEINIKEAITFNYDFSHSSSVWLCIDKDGVDYKDLYIAAPTPYTMSFDEPGTYNAMVCVYKDADYYETNKVTFSVFGLTSSVVKNNNICNVKLNAHGITNGCEIIFAGYKNGNLVAYKIVPYNQEEINTELFGDIDEIKVMAWDSLSSMIPLCEAEVIPASEFITE